MASRSQQNSPRQRRNPAKNKTEEYSTTPSQTEEQKARQENASASEERYDADTKPYPTTTLMIYLAGDNNLSEECIFAMTELKRARAQRVQIFAQYDPGDEFLPTQRYHINRCGPDSWQNPVAEDLIDQFPFRYESPNSLPIRPPYGERRERRGEGGTGDPKMLYNFVAFCVDRAPKTDHYVLLICGHGAGIQRDFLLRDNRPDGYLTIHELRLSLRMMHEHLRAKNGRRLKLDVLGMDVCLMSMAEITYELRDFVNIAIGCESYSPAAGWPYRQTVEQIDFSSKGKNALFWDDFKEISCGIVKSYVRFYSDYWLSGLSVTMSALDVNKVETLAGYIRTLAIDMRDELESELKERKAGQPLGGQQWEKSERQVGEVQNELAMFDAETQSGAMTPDLQITKDEERNGRGRHRPLLFSDALILAHWRAQSYNGELYVDIADFCDCLAEYAPRPIARLCRRIRDFIDIEFAIISCSFGRNYQYSHGVSIYFPWSSLVPYYGASIDFPADSKWINFLKTYIEATRREPRDFPGTRFTEALRERLFRKNFADVRMGSDRMGSDRMCSDGGGNPIHSMRNPAIVFIPDTCVPDEIAIPNAEAQVRLMDEVEITELLPSPDVQRLEAETPIRTLLLAEPPIVR